MGMTKEFVLALKEAFHAQPNPEVTGWNYSKLFQVLSGNRDELRLQLIDSDERASVATVSFMEDYPASEPLWFTDSDDECVSDSLETLADTEWDKTTGSLFVSQIELLLKEYCKRKEMPEPTMELEKLQVLLKTTVDQEAEERGDGDASGDKNGVSSSSPALNKGQGATSDLKDDDNDEADDDEEEDEEDEDPFEFDADDSELDFLLAEGYAEENTECKDKDDLTVEQRATLDRQEKKIKIVARRQNDGAENSYNMNNTWPSTSKNIGAVTSGSVQASDRLMKELTNIYRSESFKNGTVEVELFEDNLYNWQIKLHSKGIDSDSPLYKDLQKCKESGGEDFIGIGITFASDFPFSPPFVRLLRPYISGGHVTIGGAVCIELLTKEGWSSAYTIEAMIVQIGATLVTGEGRVIPGDSEMKFYTMSNAVDSYRRMIQTHFKQGWTTSKS